MTPPAEPLMALGPMGPFIHGAQRHHERRSDWIYAHRPRGFYALWWIGSGRAELEVDGERERLDLPAMLLQQPDGGSRVFCTGGSLWMRVDFDLVHQPLRRCPTLRTREHADDAVQPMPEQVWGSAVPVAVPTELVASGREMLDDCLAWWWRSGLGMQRAGHRLGLWLTRLAEACAGDQSPAVTDDWFARSCAMVEERIELGLTVTDLARAARMSPTTFRRRFRERAGCTPRTYLAQARLRRARDLLLQGELGMRDVAHLSGFTSRSTFSLQFHRATGCSPAEWRRRHGPGA